MQVKIEPVNAAQAKVKVSLPATFVNEKFDSYFSGLAKKAKVPGFRPGKAPKDLVKKMYAEDTASDLTERIVSEAVIHVVQEHKLELIMPPRLVATDLPVEGKDFNFEIEVDLRPTVPELDLKSIQIELPSAKPVADEEIEAQLNYAREAEATFNDLKEPRPAQKGDLAVVKFTGQVDGKTAPELQSENSSIVLGEKKFLPEFEEAVLGMQVGASKTFPLHFPEDYHAPEYRGKKAEFTVELIQIKEKHLPPLDDAFAKLVNPDLNSLEDLKKDIRKELIERNERVAQSQARELVGDKLAEKYPIEVSPRQVESLAEQLAHEAHRMMHEMHVEHQENEEHMNALRASSEKKAIRDIRLSYILQKIARDQKFDVTAEDYERRYEATARKSGFSVSQIKQYYSGKDEGSSLSRMERLKIDILDEKSLDYALSQATIKNKGSA